MATSQNATTGTPLAFSRGLVAPVLFLSATSVVIVAVPLVVYPRIGNTFVLLSVMSASFAVIAAIGWVALRSEGLRTPDVGLSLKHVLPGALPVVFIYAFMNVVAASYLLLSGESVGVAVPEGYPSLGVFIGVGLAQLLFVGTAEEFAYRAYLQNKLIALLDGGGNRVRKYGAILLGILLFTVIHIPQRTLIERITSPLEIAQSLVMVVILGVILGLLYEYTRNVVFVSVLHGTLNWQPVFVEGAPNDLALFVSLPVFLVIVWYYRRWARSARPGDFRPQEQSASQ